LRPEADIALVEVVVHQRRRQPVLRCVPIRQRLDQGMPPPPGLLGDDQWETRPGVVQEAAPQRRVGDHVGRGRPWTGPGTAVGVDLPERRVPAGGRPQGVVDRRGRPVRRRAGGIEAGRVADEFKEQRMLAGCRVDGAAVAARQEAAQRRRVVRQFIEPLLARAGVVGLGGGSILRVWPVERDLLVRDDPGDQGPRQAFARVHLHHQAEAFGRARARALEPRGRRHHAEPVVGTGRAVLDGDPRLPHFVDRRPFALEGDEPQRGCVERSAQRKLEFFGDQIAAHRRFMQALPARGAGCAARGSASLPRSRSAGRSAPRRAPPPRRSCRPPPTW
jgi:hypothetical protein